MDTHLKIRIAVKREVKKIMNPATVLLMIAMIISLFMICTALGI